MDLKKILKTLKLNEDTISMILGALVIVVVAVLVVNYFKGQKGTTVPGTKTENTISQNSAPTETAAGKHTVAKGENLWKIAETYYKSGYNWVDIARANNLKNANVITVGQVLTIPVAETRVAKVTTPTAETISGATYTVVKGDTLWSIAVRAYGDGFQWTKIAKENKLVRPNLIHSGNILILPR